MQNIAIIDFGAGNLHSMLGSLREVAPQAQLQIISADDTNFAASHIIMPGVGAFGKAMANLSEQPAVLDYLREQVLGKKTPFLGVCVGMQILAEYGEEDGNHQGLGWIPGEVKKFPESALKIPHMGWNNIEVKPQHGSAWSLDKFTNKDFYFVHSYYFAAKNERDIMAKTFYGDAFPAIIAKNNILATQFHPEKSGANGLEFLKEFVQ